MSEHFWLQVKEDNVQLIRREPNEQGQRLSIKLGALFVRPTFHQLTAQVCVAKPFAQCPIWSFSNNLIDDFIHFRVKMSKPLFSYKVFQMQCLAFFKTLPDLQLTKPGIAV